MLSRFTRATLLLVVFLGLGIAAHAAHNGTINGSLTFSAGKFSNAASGFSDSNNISLPTGTFGYSNSAFTLEAWLETTATATQVSLSVSQDSSGSSPFDWIGVLGNGHFGASIAGTGALSADGGAINGATLDSGITINDGSRHHCAVVFTGGVLKVYVDGVAGSSTLSGTPTTLTTTNGYIGRFAPAGFGWVNGQIDEVAIWNTAKYTSNFTPPATPYVGNETGLLALYHLNSDATDSQGSLGGFSPGSASLPQSDNFDSDTSGSIAPGWFNVTGSWQVGSVAPVSGKSYGDTAHADGDATLYSNMAAVADMQVYDEQVLASDQALVADILRMDSGYQNGYVILLNGAGGSFGIQFFKRVAGTFTMLSGGGTSAVAATVGTTYSVRAQIQGSTISVKVWPKASAEPPGQTFTITDSSVTAAGYAGVYQQGTVSKSVDNFTVSAPAGATASIAPNNSSILYSPGNWDVNGTRALSINAGAYFSVMFSGSTLALNFDTSNLGSPASEIYYRIDGDSGAPFLEANVASTITATLPAATAALPFHLLEVVIKSTSETINRWNSPSATAVAFTGLTVGTGATTLMPEAAPGGNVLFFGDSITEGVRTVNATATNDTDRNDATMGWAYTQRRLLGVEVGIIGFGASGLTVVGSGNVPVLLTSQSSIMSGIARTPPSNTKLIVENEATNDGGSTDAAVTAQETAVLNAWETSYPNVPIAVLRPFNGSKAAALQAGIAACNNPSLVHWIDTTGFFNTSLGSSDGLHPGGANDVAFIAPQVAAQLSPILYPKGRSNSFF